MSRQFTTNDVITFDAGGAASLPTAAMTWAVIWRPGSNHRGGLIDARDSGNFRQFGVNPFDNGDVFVALSGGGSVGYAAYIGSWALLAFTKPAGNSTIRAHVYTYDDTTWTHTDLGTVNVRSVVDHILVGSFDGGQWLDGHLAVMGAWAGTALSDGDLETLTAATSAWDALTPSWLVEFNQDEGTPLVDLTGGGGDQTAITGTTDDPAEDPPGFTYGLGPVVHQASASLALSVTQAATARRVAQAHAALTASVTAAATGRRVAKAHAALTASVTASAAAHRVAQAHAALTASVTAAATGRRVAQAHAQLTITVTLTRTGRLIPGRLTPGAAASSSLTTGARAPSLTATAGP